MHIIKHLKISIKEFMNQESVSCFYYESVEIIDNKMNHDFIMQAL